MRYIARQVPPDTQESNWSWNYDEIEGMALDGNKHLESKMCYEYNMVVEFLRHESECQFETMEELQSYTRENLYRAPELSFDEVKAIWEAINAFYDEEAMDEQELKLTILSIYTKHEWKYTKIYGCGQSDWQYVYYNADLISDEDISKVQKDYFNLGTEWEVFLPTAKEDKHLFNIYCYGDSIEEIRAEICSEIGCDDDEVKLLRFKDYEKKPVFEEWV